MVLVKDGQTSDTHPISDYATLLRPFDPRTSGLAPSTQVHDYETVHEFLSPRKYGRLSPRDVRQVITRTILL